MEKIIKKYYVLSLLVVFLLSCSEEELKQTELTANAGPDQTVPPFTTVTLDGSASVGENLNYEWTYNGGPMSSSELFLSNTNDPKPTFEPKKNGTYTFTLEVTSGIRFSEDMVTIAVTGAVTLSGTLTENVNLIDFENSSEPDYFISSDLIIPDGKSLNFPEAGNIYIKVADNAAIIIQAGGSLNKQVSASYAEITATTGWKGILVDGGRLNLNSIVALKNAGTTPHAGQTEGAAITLAGIQPNLAALSGVAFSNSGTYDLLVASPVSSSTPNDAVVSNSFSRPIPVKAPISFLPKLSFNSYPVGFSYVHLTPSGAGNIDVASGSGSFTFSNGGKFYLDGDFTSGSPITVTNATIFMKAGAGMLSQKGLTIQSSTIKGLDDAEWKGIAFADANSQMVISGSTIDGAGSDVFSTGFFTTPVKAAVYFSLGSNSSFQNSTITNSGGYGIFVDDFLSYVTVQGSTFSTTTLAAVRARVDQMHVTIGTGNTFTMPSGVAAVEVLVPNLTTTPVSTWNSLGGANYYLLSSNVRQSGGSWTLAPGVNLRLKAGKFIEIEQGLFSAIGTADSPITFDSEVGTSATWAGIHLQSTYKIEFCQIRNGGEVVILKNGVTPATEKANLVFNYGGISTANTFKNNTISGSGGYGVLVEAGKQNPDALNVANNNTFSSNTSGSVIVK